MAPPFDLELCTWPDKSVLVRFLLDDDIERWSGKAEQEVEVYEKRRKKGRLPFEFRTETRLFLVSPVGSLDAALQVDTMDGWEDWLVVERVLPSGQIPPEPHVAMKLWGLYLQLVAVPSVAERMTRLGEEDVFFGFCLPGLVPLKVRAADEPSMATWPVVSWVNEVLRFGSAGGSSSSFLQALNSAEHTRSGGIDRLRAAGFELQRRPRGRKEEGFTEWKWSAYNHVVGCRSVDQDDLDKALFDAGVCFWKEEDALSFMRKHADSPAFPESVQLELLLGILPSWLYLSTKELREVTGS